MMLFSSVGLHLNIHHCGDDTAITLYGIEFGKHCDCDHEENSDCCKEKTLIVQSDNSDKIAARLTTHVFDAYKYFLVKLISCKSFCIATSSKTISYPIIICDSSPPIYLSFKVFRI